MGDRESRILSVFPIDGQAKKVPLENRNPLCLDEKVIVDNDKIHSRNKSTAEHSLRCALELISLNDRNSETCNFKQCNMAMDVSEILQ